MWFVNTDIFVEYDSAGFVPKWLVDVMTLGKDLIFYRHTHVVYQIGRDTQRLWRIKKDKEPITVAFYHARLPVYCWMSGSVTSNMYQFDEHTMTIETMSRWDEQVYLRLSLFLTPMSARGLVHCCLSYSSLFYASVVALLYDVFRWTFRRDAEQEPRWLHASDSRAVVPSKVSGRLWEC